MYTQISSLDREIGWLQEETALKSSLQRIWATCGDLNEALAASFRVVACTLQLDRASFYTADERSGELTLLEAVGEPLEASGAEACSVPIVVQGKTAAIMRVEPREGLSAAHTASLVKTASQLLGDSITAARFRASKKPDKLSGTLLRVMDMASLGNLNDLPKIIVELVPALTGADRSNLFLWDRKDLVFVSSHSSSPAMSRNPVFQSLKLSPERVVALAKVTHLRTHVVIEDTCGSNLLPSELVDILGVKSMLLAPLIWREEIVGAITADYVEGEHHFTQDEIAIFTCIANKAAEAVRGAELSKRVSHDRSILRSLLQGMADGVRLVDASGRVLYCSQRVAELFDWSLEEAFEPESSSQREEVFSRVANPSEVVASHREALSKLETFPTLEYKLLWPVPRHVQHRFFPVYDDSGSFVGHGSIIRDVTSERELDRLKSDVISVVSHELRGPLRSIRGCATMLMQSRTDPEALVELIRVIDDQSVRLSKLVEDLNDVSRIQAGVMKILPRPTDLEEALHRVVDAAGARTKRHEFQVNLPQDLPILEADGCRIEQVIENLLDNAMKYSPNGGQISIDVEIQANSVQISVTDHGIGIQQEHLDKVFDRFFRVNSLSTTHVGGVGLGLFICKGLIEAHGGRIWAESTPGRGSTVRFTLPFAPSSATNAAKVDSPATDQQRLQSKQPSRHSARRIETGASKARILIVEDEPRMLWYLRAKFEAAGHEVTAASNGTVALQTIVSDEPDLVLLDIALPGMDGYAVCKRAREFSNVPILMLTGKGTEPEKVQGLDAGADDYLTKPFGTDELLARVRAVLRRTRRSTAGRDEIGRAITCGDLSIDLTKRNVTMRGVGVELTLMEYKLLYHLAVNQGRPMLYEDLLRLVWGPEYRSEIGYLYVHIRHLRRKIEQDPARPEYITTIPRFGYKLVCPAQ